MNPVTSPTPPVLACDLGGTRLKIAVVQNGTVLAQTVLAANSKDGLGPQLPRIQAAWLDLLEKLQLKPSDCSGIGVSFPSLIDYSRGRILDAYGKFDDAMELDLPAWARAEFNLPMAMENDARMACIGEWQYGAGRGCNDLVMVTLGTGVGTSAVLGGQLLRGRHGQAGVLGGHLTMRCDGPICACGNVGCGEIEASTRVLAELAAARADFKASALAAEPVIDFAAVFRHAAAGDACACALREHSLRVWSAIMVNLIHCYDPELLVIGGGIMAAAETILPYVRDHVRQHAHTPWGQVRIEASALGDHAALVAAEWLLDDFLIRP